MIAKMLCLALVASPLLVPAEDSPPLYANIPQVRQVVCSEWRGTAFRTGTNAFTTAWHVASGEGCSIDGEPIQVTLADPEHDVAFLHTNVTGVPLKVNCGGFVDGEAFAGVGYAKGLPLQRVIIATASDEITKAAPWKHFETLYGDRFIPGMSGGVVLNHNLEAVGVVNGYHSEIPLSFSQALKDTALCASSASARQ